MLLAVEVLEWLILPTIDRDITVNTNGNHVDCTDKSISSNFYFCQLGQSSPDIICNKFLPCNDSAECISKWFSATGQIASSGYTEG